MQIINMSLVAVPLIAVVAAVRFFTVYKLPKRTFYVLWGIVLCQLLIPYNIFARFDVSGYIMDLSSNAKTPEITAVVPAVENPINTSENLINTIPENITPPVFYNVFETVDRFGRDIFETASTEITARTSENTAKPINLYLLIWLVGFIFCAAYFIITHVRFCRIYAAALPVDNKFIRDWRVEYFYSTRRKIKIKQSDLIDSPLTYGIFKPVILLPKILNYADKKTLEYILMHEYAHIRRFDILAKLLLAGALCVHWFNPFVWLMYILANRDIELSCDETVASRADKSDYAATLLALEKKRSLLALGVYFSRNVMSERVKSIMKIKKKSIPRITAAVLLISMTIALLAALQSCVDDTPVIEIIEVKNAEGEVIGTHEVVVDEHFEMQEQTNQLVLYRTAGNDFYLNPAINIFRQKYPDVEVIIENIPWTDDYYEYLVRLNTELAAGQGPDLVLMGHYGELPDIYKMMSSGLFLDLNQLISRDSEFNLSEYNQTVLDAGIFRGRRYVMPIDYRVPIMMTTQEILDAEGITAEDLGTFEGFIKVVERYNAKYKDAPHVLPNTSAELQAFFSGYKSVFRNWRDNTWQENQRDVRNLENFFPWIGIDLIDYAAGKVALDKAQFRSVIDIMTPFYANKIEDAVDATGDGITMIGLKEQQWLFHLINHGEYLIYSVHEMLVNMANLTPLYFPYPDINDGSTALIQKCALIPNASENQINAYNLLKILLSEDMQSASSQITNKPVLISEIRERADRGLKEYSEHFSVEISYEELRLKHEELTNSLTDILINVDSAKLMPRVPYQDFLLQEMMPYWDGAASFDDAYARLVSRLEIYVSE